MGKVLCGLPSPFPRRIRKIIDFRAGLSLDVQPRQSYYRLANSRRNRELASDGVAACR